MRRRYHAAPDARARARKYLEAWWRTIPPRTLFKPRVVALLVARYLSPPPPAPCADIIGRTISIISISRYARPYKVHACKREVYRECAARPARRANLLLFAPPPPYD